MEKAMTPQQINKMLANLRVMLEKHERYFPADAVQEVLGDSAFATGQFNLFRDAVEAQAKIITREFAVDLNLVGMAAIDATGRTKYVDKKVVAAMPRATAESGVIYFFPTGRYVPVGEVDAEYEKYGLVAVDPHSLSAFNAANPEFADNHPNATQWRDVDGFCGATFDGWDGERYVDVYRRDRAWYDTWWLAGVKPLPLDI